MANKMESVYDAIDEFLNVLYNGESSIFSLARTDRSIRSIAKSIIDEHDLVIYRVPGSNGSIIDISAEGIRLIETYGGIRAYLAQKNNNLESGDTESHTHFHGDVYGNAIGFNQRSASSNVFLPTENPIEKPTTKNAASARKVIQKIGVWIISNLWQLILLVIAGLLIAYLLVRFKIPH